MISGNQVLANVDIENSSNNSHLPIPSIQELQRDFRTRGLACEALEYSSSVLISGGIGYLMGSFVALVVDLANNGIAILQKRTEKEKAETYLNSNLFSLSGLAIGSVVGMSSYIVVSELLRQRRERNSELQSVQENLNQNQSEGFPGVFGRESNLTIGLEQKDSVRVQVLFGDGADLPPHNPPSILVLGGGTQTEPTLNPALEINHDSYKITIIQPILPSRNLPPQDSTVLDASDDKAVIQKTLNSPPEKKLVLRIAENLLNSNNERNNIQSEQVSSELSSLRALGLVRGGNVEDSIGGRS